jgi:hypothetical protein
MVDSNPCRPLHTVRPYITAYGYVQTCFTAILNNKKMRSTFVSVSMHAAAIVNISSCQQPSVDRSACGQLSDDWATYSGGRDIGSGFQSSNMAVMFNWTQKVLKRSTGMLRNATPPSHLGSLAWPNLVQDWIQWQAFYNTVLNIWVPWAEKSCPAM